MNKSHFRLKKPCASCPFLKSEQAVSLREGRLEGIVNHLLEDDHSTFQCHQTVHNSKGGYWDQEGGYMPSGHEAMCYGSMIFLHKIKGYTVGMRIALMSGIIKLDDLEKQSEKVIDSISDAKVI